MEPHATCLTSITASNSSSSSNAPTHASFNHKLTHPQDLLQRRGRRPRHRIRMEIVHPRAPVIPPRSSVAPRYNSLTGRYRVAADRTWLPVRLACVAREVCFVGVYPAVLAGPCAEALLHLLVHGHFQHIVARLQEGYSSSAALCVRDYAQSRAEC
jgi:hypothetical protein